MADDLDVLIVGAGISGIGVACRLRTRLPGLRFVILESRADLGGTWDQFRFPGVRSDSDMLTLGYRFRPWNGTATLADGASILRYLNDTVDEYGLRQSIRFGTRVVSADWSSSAAAWSVRTAGHGSGTAATGLLRARFVVMATGYFRQQTGYRPEFPGACDFDGPVVHPQRWPADLDVAGRRVAVIGSGATAVTLVPALVRSGAEVSMVQRSPGYLISLPTEDAMLSWLRRKLPATAADRIARLRNILLQRATYRLARHAPQLVRRLLLDRVRAQLGPDADMADWTPRYQPWDQRLCVVAGGDLFRAVRSGRATAVTGEIERIVPDGIRLTSDRLVPADIIVTATGLDLSVLGDAELRVDGERIDAGQRVTYRGVLLDGVPNLAMVVGYVNSSWTLRAELTANYLCRLLRHQARHGFATVVAHADPSQRTSASAFDALSSGYIRRAGHLLPRQGRSGPWRLRQDYLADVRGLRWAPVRNRALRFDGPPVNGSAGDRSEEVLDGVGA